MTIHASSAAMRHSLRRGPAKLLLCAAGAAALTLTATAPAAAGVGPAGTGSPLCQAGYTGTMTFTPALVNAGTATSETAGLTLAFDGCTGGTPRPKSGTYTATGTVTGAGANDCANWLVQANPPVVNFSSSLTGTVTWSPASIAPSTVSFARMRIGTGGPGRLLVKLPGTASTVTGSYAPTANLMLRTMQTWASVLSACTSGLAGLTIVPMNSATAISQGTW